MRSMPLKSNHNPDRIELPSQVNYLFLVFVLTKDFFSSVLKANFLNTANILFLLLSVAVAITANRNYLRLLSVKPILFWSLWVAYAFLAWAIIGIRSEGKPLNFILNSFVYPIITMCIVCYEGNKNLRRTTLVVLVALSAYVIAGMLFQDHSAASSAWEAERGGHQMGNALPLRACVLTFIAMFAYVKDWIGKKWIISLVLLSLVTILYVATRKAFVGWIIVMGVSMLSRFKFNKPWDWLKFLVLLLAALFIYNYIMDHTYLGVRMQGTVEQGMAKNETDVETLNYLGDRSIQYIMAWEEFQKHPVTGIGLQNFQSVTGFYFRLHSEYMVQLCECGIVGATLYLLFIIGLFSTLFKSRIRGDNRPLFVCLGGLLSILFINFTAWTYEICFYFAIYGIILAVCNPVAAKAPVPRYSIIDSYWAQLPVPRLRLVFALRHLAFVFTERVGLCVRYVVRGVSRSVRGFGAAMAGLGTGFVRAVTGVYGAVARVVRGVGSAIVGLGTSLLRAKGVWYALASFAALAVVGGGIWYGMSHFDLQFPMNVSRTPANSQPSSQVAEVATDTKQVSEDTYEDELDYSTVVEDNTGMLRCAVPESWMKGFDLVISWRCDAPDVCFQIRPVGTKKWTTMHYNDTGKNSDIIPYTLQKEYLASGETLEWRLFARFPDNTTVVKTGNVTLVN